MKEAFEMNENKAPDGMIPVEKFANMKGLTIEKVIAMVKDGFYVGRVVNDHWYIDPAEASEGGRQRSSSAGSVGYQSDYDIAKKVSKFMSAIGWLVFGCGILTSIIGLAAGLGTQSRYGGGGSTVTVMALLPALGLSISGLFLIAIAQVTRATVDNADHTREILRLLNKSN